MREFYPPIKSKIYIGMSGGVDSSVTAALLKAKGYEVRGVYMRCWNDPDDPLCTTDRDQTDALRVAAHIGVSFEVWDFEKEYKKKVLDYFLSEYREGRTPNPDVLCNSEIKFGIFLDEVIRRDSSAYIAMGHYVRSFSVSGLTLQGVELNFPSNTMLMASGVDEGKDQSYFLYRLSQKELIKSVFPLGNYKKSQVRGIASRKNLCTATKKDSQGVCFTGGLNVRSFIKKHVKCRLGDVIDLQGRVIGEHQGLNLYTLGQRHGFEVYSHIKAPLYVIDKDFSKNSLIVGLREKAYSSEFIVGNIHWVSDEFKKLLDIQRNNRVMARIRNLGDKIFCNIKYDCEDNGQRVYYIKLSNKEFGISLGQSVVFYVRSKLDKDNIVDMVLGGGVISQVNTSYKKHFEFPS